MPGGAPFNRSIDADDRRHMARALQLAANADGRVHPNPRVGCVLVADGNVVGEGWHHRAGDAHAEAVALAHAAQSQSRPTTAYITLEPCAHHGRTPPCVESLINAGIARAVIAMPDPNPRVNGAGIAALTEAGVEVCVGLERAHAEQLNRGFCMRMRAGRPWVALKIAASLDGKTALADGQSQWISGAAARADVHRRRAMSSAILTGIGTVMHDNPQLTARVADTNVDANVNVDTDVDVDIDIDINYQPLRVVLDGALGIDANAKVLQPPGKVLVLAGRDAVVRCGAQLAAQAQGDIIVAACALRDGRLDLRAVMRELAAREINEVLVEAGARLCTALLADELVDEIILYVAARLLGDDARGMFALPGLASLDARHFKRRLAFRQATLIGADVRLLLDVVDDGDGDGNSNGTIKSNDESNSNSDNESDSDRASISNDNVVDDSVAATVEASRAS